MSDLATTVDEEAKLKRRQDGITFTAKLGQQV